MYAIIRSIIQFDNHSYLASPNHVIELVTGHNGHKPKRPQPKRPQTETATNRNGHKPERPQTGTATNRNGHKPERPQTGTATNRNGHKPKRPQTGTATNRNGHISCHQNKYDGESPIGNDDIHYKLHRNRGKDCLFFWGRFLLITCWIIGQSTTKQHWLIWWLGADQATGHHLDQ